MRDIILIYTVKATFCGKEELLTCHIPVVKYLEENDETISIAINDMCEEKNAEYCTCSFNESQNYCDCSCGEWNGEFVIVSRECEYGCEL